MESAVRLVVKTPNQQFKDVHVDCDFGWTVKKLKEYLTNVYPTKPESHIQRLIYSGHLLKDEVQLRDILNKDHKSHTLHIVCPFIPVTTDTKTKPDAKNDNKQNLNDTTQPEATAQSNLRRRIPATYSAHQAFASNTQQQQQQSPMSSWNQYAAAMQQYYAAWSQYQAQNYAGAFQNPYAFQQWQSAVMTSSPQPSNSRPVAQPFSPTSPLVQNPASTETPVAEEPETVDGIPDQGPVDQGQDDVAINQRNEANQPQPINAAGPGGAMFDDEDENGDGRRDWLDWVYAFLRASVMLSIMYFYSSTIRILMIGLLGLIIYLYQAGWLFVGRRPRGAEVAEDRNLNNAREGDENRPNDPDEDNPNNELNQNHPTQQENHPGTQSVFAVMYTFVSSFFTSLLPQNVQ